MSIFISPAPTSLTDKNPTLGFRDNATYVTMNYSLFLKKKMSIPPSRVVAVATYFVTSSVTVCSTCSLALTSMK